MERYNAKRSLRRFVGHIWLRRLEMAVLAFLFMPILNSNAEMHGNARYNLSHPGVDAIAEFEAQLYAWREGQKRLAGLEIKLDRRFKAPKCQGSYSFNVIKNSLGLIRAECHSPRWSRVLKTRNERPSSLQNRQTDRVWVASKEIAAGQLLTSKQFKKVSIDARKIPRNALKRPPDTKSKAKRTIKTGEIILTSSIYEPKYGYVAKTTIPSGSFFKAGTHLQRANRGKLSRRNS